MKRWISVAVTAALLTAAAGCSDPGTDASTDNSAVTWTDPTAKLDGVKLTIWAAQNSNTVPQKVIDGFQKATGATVQVVTIPDPYEQGVQTKVATGDKPDLAFWQPTASMLTAINAKTNLQPLTDAPWLGQLAPDLKEVLTQGAKAGLPKGLPGLGGAMSKLPGLGGGLPGLGGGLPKFPGLSGKKK